MKLNLRVTSCKGETPGNLLSISLDQQSATIGRLQDNTLVLPDANRYLSGHHAKIEYRKPDYYIIDTSTNGVFINHSPTPLGYDNSAKLQNQGFIAIGDYDIAFEITEESQEIPVVSNDIPLVPDSVLPGSGPSNDGIIEFPDDPFADLTSDPIKQMIESNELIPDDGKSNSDTEINPDPFDIPYSDHMGTDSEQRKEFDHVPAYQEAFEPFQKKNEIQQSDITESSTSNPTDIFSDDWFTKDKYNDQENDQKNDHEKKETSDELPVENLHPSLNKPNPNNTIQSTTETRDQDDLIQSFLRGASLNDERLPGSISADTFHTIGAILRASIQGGMDVLASRSKIKSEMHLDVTMIRPVQNNPIKFSVSADEALTKLLLHQDEGYLPAKEAVNEAFDDIRAHQLSVIAGMQTALIEILQRFDPEKLEQRLQKQSPISAGIPIHKKAKLWNLFEQLYEEIEHEAEDDFYHLFGQAFAESYDQQIKKFKAAKDEIPIE